MKQQIFWISVALVGSAHLVSCSEESPSFQTVDRHELTLTVGEDLNSDDLVAEGSGSGDDGQGVLDIGGADDDGDGSAGSMGGSADGADGSMSSDGFGDGSGSGTGDGHGDGSEGADDEFWDAVADDTAAGSGSGDTSDEAGASTGSSDSADASSSGDASNGAGAEDGGRIDEDDSDGKVAKACGSKFRGKPKVKFIQYRKVANTKISSQDVIALKLNGNQPVLDLNILGDAGDSVKGICLFLTGNQSQANINLNVNLKGLLIVARGNKVKANIEIDEGGRVDAMYADMAGNAPALNLFGAGEYPCETVRSRNDSVQFQCE